MSDHSVSIVQCNIVQTLTSNSQHAGAAGTADEFADLEILSISAASDDESDDGFLTDEEYDILDASDRETVASP